MKFVSKNVNYRLILKPSSTISEDGVRRIIPGIFVKFENGVAIVNDEKRIELMKSNPYYGTDFVSPEDDSDFLFKTQRQDSEPKHTITAMKYGHFDETIGDVKKGKKEEFEDAVAKASVKFLKNLLGEKEFEKILAENLGKKDGEEKAEKEESVDEEKDAESLNEDVSEDNEIDDNIDNESSIDDNVVQKRRGRPSSKDKE